MEKGKVAGICEKIGVAVAASTLGGSPFIAAYKKEVPMSLVVIIFFVGIALLLIGVFYNKIKCSNCGVQLWHACATKLSNGESVCDVCNKKRLEYPVWSTDVPEKARCRKCYQSFHVIPFMWPEDGKNYTICLWCAGDPMIGVPAYDPYMRWSIAMLVIAIVGILGKTIVLIMLKP